MLWKRLEVLSGYLGLGLLLYSTTWFENLRPCWLLLLLLHLYLLKECQLLRLQFRVVLDETIDFIRLLRRTVQILQLLSR